MNEDYDFSGGSGGVGGVGGDAVGTYFRFVDLIVSKAQGTFAVEYPKLMFHLGPLMVASATSEYQKHTVLTSLIQYYVAALSPVIRQMKKSKRYEPEVKEDIIGRYEELRGFAMACGIVKISASLVRAGDYNKYSFTTDFSTMPKEKKPAPGEKLRTNIDILSDIEMNKLQCNVECGEGALIVGRDIARDNGYSRINCQAENTMNKALTLAFDLGIIDLDDHLKFDSGDVTPEENERKINRRQGIRAQLDREEEDIDEGD